MFRKEEIAVSEWTPENVRHCAERQQEILENAAGMLKPGGRMVYSTCTFAPEENEKSICRFLAVHPEFELERAPEYEGLSRGVPEWGEYPENAEISERISERKEIDLTDTVRIWPHRTDGEGHYIAVLKKTGEPGTKKRKYPSYEKEKKTLADYERFCQAALSRPEDWIGRKEYILFGEQLYLLPPEMPSFDGLRVLRPGLHLGTLKKNRFEPSHALALALKPEEAVLSKDLSAETEETAAYLRGETLSGESIKDFGNAKKSAGGWTLITVDGYSLGWAKFAGGILKNHYPKGLRRG